MDFLLTVVSTLLVYSLTTRCRAMVVSVTRIICKTDLSLLLLPLPLKDYLPLVQSQLA